jgi:hypothetical protein
MRKLIRVLPLLALAALGTACTMTKVLKPEVGASIDPAAARVLVLPLDIELYVLEAGGLTAPRADWTKAAREHVSAAVLERLGSAKAGFVVAHEELVAADSKHLQLFKLHEAIGNAIYNHQAGGAQGQAAILPTLKNGFDWTLGEGVQELAADTGANYALFVHIRDSYATAGRKAAMVSAILVAGLTGVYLPVGTGVRTGFASLVDLKTGEVVWFNRLYSETGDLREGEPAAKTAGVLLKDLPL